MNRATKMLLVLLIGFLGAVVTPMVLAAVTTTQDAPIGVRGKSYFLTGSSIFDWDACARFEPGGVFRFRSNDCIPSVVASGKWSEIDLIFFSVWRADFSVTDDCGGPPRDYSYNGISLVSLITVGNGTGGLFSGPFIGFVAPCGA